MTARLGTLLVVYHRPFWRTPDGGLWEREGAFSRYIESLAPHVDRIVLAVPEAPPPPESEQGHRLAATNVALAPLPYYDGLPRFFRVLPRALAALWRVVGRADVVNLRLPTPAGPWAYALARLRRRPVFLLVVGDLAGVAAAVPRDSLRRRLYHAYVRLDERLLQWMVDRSLTVTNGRALYERHARPGRPIYETRNSTIRTSDVARPRDSFRIPDARLLCVSRVDPRKGVRYLPKALAVLRERGFRPTLEVIGPTVGPLGEQERTATIEAARRLGLEADVHFRGAASLEEVYAAYTQHDLLIVPSLPGEGIPRVLLEAMAAGLPVVASRVAGIPDLVRDGENGFLVPPADGPALGAAVARLLTDAELRERCVARGYETARAHTADAQAAWLIEVVASHLMGGTGNKGQSRGGVPDWPVRLTIPLAGLNLSGGVKSLLQLSNHLAERGAAVRLIVPDYAAVPPVQLDPRIRLTVLTTSGPGPVRKLGYLARLTCEAAANTDIVLANYFLTAYPAVASWLLHGRRVALGYNVRGYEPWSHGLMAPSGRVGRYGRFALAWLSYRLPLARLVTTDWLARMVGDPGATVVGHGIDLGVFRPKERRESLIVTVGVIGRHGAAKGYPDFLAAAERLPADLPIRFLVARADPVALPRRHQAEAIEARSEAAMADFYRRCGVFVFPSLAEGFGLPALEAMACGCALVTTDCGGISTFARADENCLIVPPGQPEQLARAIEHLARDPDLRVRLAGAGIQTARAFDRDAALDRLADAVLALARRR